MLLRTKHFPVSTSQVNVRSSHPKRKTLLNTSVLDTSFYTANFDCWGNSGNKADFKTFWECFLHLRQETFYAWNKFNISTYHGFFIIFLLQRRRKMSIPLKEFSSRRLIRWFCITSLPWSKLLILGIYWIRLEVHEAVKWNSLITVRILKTLRNMKNLKINPNPTLPTFNDKSKCFFNVKLSKKKITVPWFKL